MAKQNIILLVTTSCQPEDEVEFNRWYSEFHIPSVFNCKEVKAVSRFRFVDKSLHKYLALWEFESQKDLEKFLSSPEVSAGQRDMQKTWGSNFQILSRDTYELIRKWEKE